MEFVIENEHLIVTVKDKGAEVSSVIAKKTGIEYIWQADEKVWNRHAPVLFPFVGRLKEDSFRYQGNTYPMGQHGFARDSKFSVHERLTDSITFILAPNGHFKDVYPFLFELQLTYQLFENQLSVIYKVKNLDENTMYYSIGGHPGFNVPLTEGEAFEDYYVKMAPETSRERLLLEGPYLAADKALEVEQNKFPLQRELFLNDAIILKTPEPTTVTLASKKGEHGVTMSYEDFDYLGIWTKPQQDATYVCLEPWCGLADRSDSDGALERKTAIQSLEPGNKRYYVHRIAFF